MPDLERMLSRVNSISIVIETDTGKKIKVSADTERLLRVPGLSAGIHSLGSVIGSLTGSKLENWYKENPKEETKLQKDIKAGWVSVRKYRLTMSDINIENQRLYIELYSREKGGFKKYWYDSYAEAKEDIEYCRDYLLTGE